MDVQSAVLSPFRETLMRACKVVMVCNNPYHVHRSPLQVMASVEYFGHHVAVTLDGDVYSVRIDRDALTDRYGLTEADVCAYVDSKINKEVIDV